MKKLFNKLVVILIAVFMLLSLSACGDKKDSENLENIGVRFGSLEQFRK